jgi:FtsP/CotA-like multicopper oxidase with cupredoxin domain
MTDALLGPAAGPVGFAATIVSRRRLGVVLPFRQFTFNDIRYDREFVLLYQDADDRWNLAVDAGEQPDLLLYEPNFHTLNGLTFPQTASDPDTRITCNLGDIVQLRMGNLGHVRHAVHFHGYHADIISCNNVPETMLPSKDTIPLPGYSTSEIALPIVQPGVFPIHPHSLTSTTDNGLYPFGQITLIDAAV